MDIPGGMPLNPAAETAMAATARKATGPKEEQAASKQTHDALDPARRHEGSRRAAERREEGRGLKLDIRA